MTPWCFFDRVLRLPGRYSITPLQSILIASINLQRNHADEVRIEQFEMF